MKKIHLVIGAEHCVVSILVVGAVFITGFYILYSEADKPRVFPDISLPSDTVGNEALFYLEGKLNRAIDFASDGFIKNGLYAIKHTDGTNLNSVTRDLNIHLTENKLPVDKEFYRVELLDTNGVVVSTTDDKTAWINLSENPEFIEGKKIPRASNVSYDSVANLYAITLSAPIYKENEFVGVVVIKLLPDRLNNINLD